MYFRTSIFGKIWGYIKRKDVLFITGLFVFTRLLIVAVGMISFMFFSDRLEPFYGVTDKTFHDAFNFQKQWDVFDTGWYMSVAKDGYPQKPFENKEMSNWGFMPLYPILMKGGTYVFGDNYFLVGTLLSNVFTLAALLIINEFIKEKYGENTSTKVVTAILVSAGSFFLSIPYTEGLFLLIAVLVLYLTYKKKYSWAIILAGMATVTRTQGVTLFLVPTIDMIINLKWKAFKYIPFYLIALLPLAVFMYYLYRTCGEPLAFVEMQAAWGAKTLYPMQAFFSILYRGKGYVVSTVNAIFWVIFMIPFVKNIKKIPVSWVIFAAVYFLLSTCTEVVYGTTRYVLGLLPAFVAIALSNKYYYKGFLLLNAMFLTLSIALFVNSVFLFV